MPGEIIVCNARIENASNRDITRMTLKLVQEAIFTGYKKTLISQPYLNENRCCRDVVSQKIEKVVSSKSNQQVLQDQMIVIPPICASSIGMSKIIEINYFLVFSFGAFGSDDQIMSIPLKIGTIPLMNSQSENIARNYLPTYEQSLLENAQTTEPIEPINGEIYDTDEKTFKPIYPYFKDYTY